MLLYLAKHLNTIDLRHADVQEEQVRPVGLNLWVAAAPEEKIERFLAVNESQHRRGNVRPTQAILDQKGVPIIIVGDQNCLDAIHDERRC